MFAPNTKNTSSEVGLLRSLMQPADEPKAGASRADNPVLIREAQLGSSAAFEELVRQYGKAALRLAFRLTGSECDAQDVCQEAFLSAYQNLSSFRFECSFYTWIYRIVTNRCLDYLRRRRSLHENLASKVRVDGDTEVWSRAAHTRRVCNPERELVARELRSYIRRALEKLSPCERTVFELKHYHDLDLRSVAAILKTSEGNARHALFRARQKLRNALAEVR